MLLVCYFPHILIVGLPSQSLVPLNSRRTIFFVFLFITQPSGLLSQKDFSTSVSSTIGESALTRLFALPLTFSIASSFAAFQISSVSSVETTPVRKSSLSGVKYSDTNFPSEISIPFETNSQSLQTDFVLHMSSCTR